MVEEHGDLKKRSLPTASSDSYIAKLITAFQKEKILLGLRPPVDPSAVDPKREEAFAQLSPILLDLSAALRVYYQQSDIEPALKREWKPSPYRGEKRWLGSQFQFSYPEPGFAQVGVFWAREVKNGGGFLGTELFAPKEMLLRKALFAVVPNTSLPHLKTNILDFKQESGKDFEPEFVIKSLLGRSDITKGYKAHLGVILNDFKEITDLMATEQIDADSFIAISSSLRWGSREIDLTTHLITHPYETSDRTVTISRRYSLNQDGVLRDQDGTPAEFNLREKLVKLIAGLPVIILEKGPHGYQEIEPPPPSLA